MNEGSIKQWIGPDRKSIVGRIKWITMKSEETTFSLNHLNMLLRSETIMATLWESIWKEVHVVFVLITWLKDIRNKINIRKYNFKASKTI